MSLRRWTLLLTAMMVIAVFFGFCGCGSGKHVDSGYDPPDTWAFYWYLCGSDLESESGMGTFNLEAMLRVKLPENISVIIETGGARQWQSNIPANQNSRYIYDSEGCRLLERNPQSNMGGPSTLADFLLFCNENYPADRCAVIFWNHGGGSVSGAAFDELYNMDSLKLTEMRAAFEAAGLPERPKGDTKYRQKYELIGFDTCLMASIDVANTFADYANWLVASQELEPGGGWDYEAFFSALANDPSMDGLELGKIICDSFYAACERTGEAEMATLSVIDLKQTPALVKAYNDVGAEALTYAGLDSHFFNEFGRAALHAENYGGNSDSEGYTNMVDIGDLMQKAGDPLLPKTRRAMLQAVDNAVAYQVKGALRSEASGISCYYNYSGEKHDFNGYAAVGTSPAFRHFYDYAISGSLSGEGLQYVKSVSRRYTGKDVNPKDIDVPNRDDLKDFPVTVDQNGFAVLNIGTKYAGSLMDVYCNLAYVDERGAAYFLGSDINMIADWEKGVFTENFHGLWGAVGGTPVYMEITERTDDYEIYSVPILLNGEEYVLNVSRRFSDGTYKILGAHHCVDGHNMSDRNLRSLESGDVIEPLHYAMPDNESDNNGNLEKAAVGKIIYSEQTRFEEILLSGGHYLLMFEMRDMQNKSYFSEKVTVTIKDGKVRIGNR